MPHQYSGYLLPRPTSFAMMPLRTTMIAASVILRPKAVTPSVILYRFGIVLCEGEA